MLRSLYKHILLRDFLEFFSRFFYNIKIHYLLLDEQRTHGSYSYYLGCCCCCSNTSHAILHLWHGNLLQQQFQLAPRKKLQSTVLTSNKIANASTIFSRNFLPLLKIANTAKLRFCVFDFFRKMN